MSVMKTREWTVAVAITIVGLPGVSVSQTTGAASGVKVQPPPAAAQTIDPPLSAEDVKNLPDLQYSCSKRFGSGRRIVSNMGIVEFRVSRFTPITKSIDADFVAYGIRYGAKADNVWLTMWFGLQVGGETPHELQNGSIKWVRTSTTCRDGVTVRDWRGTAEDGRRWRHIAIPLSGFAAYGGVPPKAADYFDKILNTMCCGECPYCQK